MWCCTRGGIRRKAIGATGAVAFIALLLSSCAPAANTGPTAVADGVRFDYALASAGASDLFHVTLTLADAKSGAQITDATVAMNLFGPGYPGGTLVSLNKVTGAHVTYVADVALRQSADYQLTFQVNRPPPADSAQVAFTATRPAAS